MKDERIVGHKTFRDGLGFRHEPLYESEGKALLASCDAAAQARRDLMPDEDSAIRMMFAAHTRLHELGWRDAVYCPKDGSVFEVLEPGSTGRHKCIYEGEWPTGHWWILSDDDMSPSRPVLFKKLPIQAPVHKESPPLPADSRAVLIPTEPCCGRCQEGQP